MSQNSAPGEDPGATAPPEPKGALLAAMHDLRTLEACLGGVRDSLVAVPLSRDPGDATELAIEHLMADVAQALHKLMLARMEAEHGVRMAGLWETRWSKQTPSV